MIKNLLGRFWGTESLLELVNNLPKGFDVCLYTVTHKCIMNSEITFKERFIDSISIEYEDKVISFEIGEKALEDVHTSMVNFIDKYKPKTEQPDNINELRTNTINNVKSVLSINNDEEIYNEKHMVFELNRYHPIERERIIKLLSTVDDVVPSVKIEINLSSSTVEELSRLNDRLVEVEVLS